MKKVQNSENSTNISVQELWSKTPRCAKVALVVFVGLTALAGIATLACYFVGFQNVSHFMEKNLFSLSNHNFTVGDTFIMGGCFGVGIGMGIVVGKMIHKNHQKKHDLDKVLNSYD